MIFCPELKKPVYFIISFTVGYGWSRNNMTDTRCACIARLDSYFAFRMQSRADMFN